VQLSEETTNLPAGNWAQVSKADGTITITAPIAGTVADRDTTTGESVKMQAKKVMTIINGSSVQVSANI